MSIRAVAFDLGNTLVEYYHMRDFPSILDEVIACSYNALPASPPVAPWEARRAADDESAEQSNWQVIPLFERLTRVFGLMEGIDPSIENRCCREFLKPIFQRARLYPETQSTLARLRADGYRLAIVSNTPWGSPGELWRDELGRLGLSETVDASIFCTDVGWRKPAPPIFDAALNALGAKASECVFVGDHLEWDVEGARAAGMIPVLIDRANEYPDYGGHKIQSLTELWPLLDVGPLELNRCTSQA